MCSLMSSFLLDVLDLLLCRLIHSSLQHYLESWYMRIAPCDLCWSFPKSLREMSLASRKMKTITYINAYLDPLPSVPLNLWSLFLNKAMFFPIEDILVMLFAVEIVNLEDKFMWNAVPKRSIRCEKVSFIQHSYTYRYIGSTYKLRIYFVYPPDLNWI